MVPAHSEIPGNEKADVFARAAANQAASYDDVPVGGQPRTHDQIRH